LPAASIYPAATGFGNAGGTLPAGTYYLAPASATAGSNFYIESSVDLVMPLIGQDLREISGDFVVNITFSSIPEPAAMAMIGGVGLLLGARRRA